MPLQPPVGNAFVRSDKVFIDSEKATSSQGPMNIVVDLPKSIEYVTAIELTGWNLSNNLMPSVFSFPGGVFNDRFQILVNHPIENVTKALTVVLPKGNYSLVNTADDTFTLPFAVESYLQAVLDNDGDLGIGELEMQATVALTSEMRLRVSMVDKNGNVPFISFLFESSTFSTNNLVHRLLGFDKEDGLGATVITGSYVPEVDYFRYIDVVVDGLEHNPLARIFRDAQSGFSTILNDPNLTRTRLILNNPMRRLSQLRISLFLRDNLQLPDDAQTRSPFDLCFTVQSLVNKNEPLPEWLHQSFLL